MYLIRYSATVPDFVFENYEHWNGEARSINYTRRCHVDNISQSAALCMAYSTADAILEPCTLFITDGSTILRIIDYRTLTGLDSVTLLVPIKQLQDAALCKASVGTSATCLHTLFAKVTAKKCIIWGLKASDSPKRVYRRDH